MRKEIQKELEDIKILAKQTRERIIRNIGIIVILALLFYFAYYYSQQVIFYSVSLLIALFGGIYIIFSAIPTLWQPLSAEDYAFKKIVQAIEILEKSCSQIALEEASRHINQSYKNLKAIDLSDLEWYEATNYTLTQFIEHLHLLATETTARRLKLIDLEEAALALSSRDSSKIDRVNMTIANRETYHFSEPQSAKAMIFLKKIKENKPVRLLLANMVSFFVVLVPIWFHSMIFQTTFADYFNNITNFLTVLAIVIALGALIYGIIKRL